MAKRISVFVSTVSANFAIKQDQQKIIMILESKNIPFDQIDVAASEDAKARMREIAENPKALPPQIINGSEYCGDYKAFEEAVECEMLEEFLKLK